MIEKQKRKEFLLPLKQTPNFQFRVNIGKKCLHKKECLIIHLIILKETNKQNHQSSEHEEVAAAMKTRN